MTAAEPQPDIFRYCDVALPVPLDRYFTYLVKDPVEVGCRVIVPFQAEKLIGVVVKLHNEAPPETVKLRTVEAVVDDEPLLPDELMNLGEWIAQYYLAPPGEVLRAMLPLQAEVRRHVLYRMAPRGREVLVEAAMEGSSRRARVSAEMLDAQYRVLNYLEHGEAVRSSRIRTATGASQEVLQGMLRKRWVLRETAAEQRNAARVVRVAVLVPEARLPRLTANQQAILAELAAAGGELSLVELRQKSVSSSTLQTLVKRGIVRIDERPAGFAVTTLSAAPSTYKLNPEQLASLEAITQSFGAFHPMLLHGVTGSGKTAVYLAAMQAALEQGYSSILLVPEIGLTPQTASQLYAAFGSNVALLHSALTPEERAEQWRRIRTGDAPIVVGTRSAVFAPVPRLGLVLVDEEHDQSYKQEETPRYQGRDVAVMRAKLVGAVVVLGSATPSLESWHNADRGRYRLLTMSGRVAGRPLPEVEVVDMRREFEETSKDDLFARTLVEQTEATLARNEQAIILINRRGYSFVVLCRACGEKIECENCAIAMTHHRQPSGDLRAQEGERLECHWCGFRRPVPKTCPKCGSEHLYYLGAGSQQGEERLAEIFPHARIGRMDRDTVRGRGDMERLLGRLHSGEINLLVGTQMIAKGHDIHGVTLVGVVGADHALGMPDFRAAERVFQLLTQVSGRAGRGELAGRVVVQSWHPDHYAIECAARHDFLGFVERELKFRRWMHYPPFGVLANVLVHSERMEEAAGWASVLGRFFESHTQPGIRLLGPAASPVARLKRSYRFHLVLKGENRQALQRALRAMLRHAEMAGIPRPSLVVDVDPVNLM